MLVLVAPASAGPPFLTDDPEPTDTRHWEIYAPMLDAGGRGDALDGAIGAEINYGAARDIQVTLGLPVAFTRESGRLRGGRGDIELSVKSRFYHDDAAGVSIAAFPGLTLPTARRGFGNRRITALLPVWVQKNAGEWSVFGGGGYAVNPGDGNRDFLTGGVAVTRQVTGKLLLGVEMQRQGRDTEDGRATTSPGVGAILELGGPFRVLASAGPTFEDGHPSAGFHSFAALGLSF